MCVCVCVRESERERQRDRQTDRQTETDRQPDTHTHTHIYAQYIETDNKLEILIPPFSNNILKNIIIIICIYLFNLIY